jgi:hypothetical protein
LTITDIRHVAVAASADDVFATAAFEQRVSVWSLPARSLVAELETILDFGGQRLALCGSETPLVVAGAWGRHGIRAYGVDGRELWQRKDLRQPQQISAAARGALAVVCFDDRSMHVLAAESGDTVAKVRGARRFYDSPFAAKGLVEMYGHVGLVDTDRWQLCWRAPVEGFAILSAAAAPDSFAVADVVHLVADRRSSVSCLDLGGGVLWRWTAPPQVNCPALAWDAERAEWAGLLNDVTNERPDTLVRWSRDGEVVFEHPLALYHVAEFMRTGRYFVTSEGEVRDSRDGTVVWQFGGPSG